MSSIQTMYPYCISSVDLDPPEILLLPPPAPAAFGSCQRSPSQRCHATRSRCS
jgi:hypothetical protein